MKHIKLLAGLLSLLAGLSVAAHATPVSVSTSSTDLLLGFRASGGTNGNLNIQVDLGAVSLFTSGNNVTPGIHTVASLSSYLTDATNGYGAGYSSRTDITWGLGSSSLGLHRNIYGTYASTPGTQFDSASVSVLAQGLRDSAGSKITGTASGWNGATSVFNSTSVNSSPSSDPSSWTAQMTTDAGVAFGYFDLSTFENTTNVSGGSYVVSDLYKQSSTGVVSYIGTFALDAAGTLYFSNSAASFGSPVPEPATYAALAGVLALGVAAYRRRQQGKVAA